MQFVAFGNDHATRHDHRADHVSTAACDHHHDFGGADDHHATAAHDHDIRTAADHHDDGTGDDNVIAARHDHDDGHDLDSAGHLGGDVPNPCRQRKNPV